MKKLLAPAFLFTLLLLVLAELGARLFLAPRVPFCPQYFSHTDSYQNAPWIKDYDREIFTSYNSTWRSYVYWRRTPHQGKYINIDRQGIRYTTPSNLTDGEARKKLKIFMFGGSTMWGEGVRDQYTLPSLVCQDLSVHKIKAGITNFGEVGYVNTQELIELVLQLERGNIPDVVVFYDGFNDVYSAWQNSMEGLPQNESNRELEYNITKRYNTLRKEFFLKTIDQFYLTKTLKNWTNIGRPSKSAVKDTNGLEKKILDVYLNNIKIIVALGKAYGFVPIFYWEPVIYTKKNLTHFEQKYISKPIGALYDTTHALLKVNQSKLVDYNFHDITGLFLETKEPVYLDYCHSNEEAHKIIARRIAQDITAAVGVAPTP
jgi:lysophospholipase L1-like esterase